MNHAVLSVLFKASNSIVANSMFVLNFQDPNSFVA